MKALLFLHWQDQQQMVKHSQPELIILRPGRDNQESRYWNLGGVALGKNYPT